MSASLFKGLGAFTCPNPNIGGIEANKLFVDCVLISLWSGRHRSMRVVNNELKISKQSFTTKFSINFSYAVLELRVKSFIFFKLFRFDELLRKVSRSPLLLLIYTREQGYKVTSS